VLSELIARPDTPLSDDVKARILGQLASAQQRFTAISGGLSGEVSPRPGNG